MSEILERLSDELATSVQSVGPSIVRVNGRRRLPASGVVWSSDGIIVTAHHILERDDNIDITLHDGSTHNTTLVGRDPGNDLAVLRVDTSLTPANWADDDALQVGHLVLAMGRPSNQIQATLGVTSALVTGKGEGHSRKGHGGRRHRGHRGRGRALLNGYIQTDVVMYPGFSGGPLVSADGKVHGLNTSGFSRGISITVPVASIRKSVETLLSHGRVRQGYLGVGVQPVRLPETVTDNLEQETGLLIVSIEANSPAALAGLLVGDILVSLDDEMLTTIDELLGLLGGDRVGNTVSGKIVRGGNLQEFTVMIGERE